MRRFMGLVALGLAAVAVASMASAGDCKLVQRVVNVHHGHAAQHVVVERFVAVEHGHGYGYGHGHDDYHLELLAGKLRKKQQEEKLSDRLDRIEKLLSQQKASVPAASTSTSTSPSTAPASKPAASGETYQDAALRLFRERCAECHTGGSSSGNFALFDEAGELTRLNGADAVLVDHYCYDNLCPKGTVKKLSAEEYSQVRAYLAQFSGEARRIVRAADRETVPK